MCRSLAGYSVFCYLLALGDRHNDNIMVTTDGHLFRILSHPPLNSFALSVLPSRCHNLAASQPFPLPALLTLSDIDFNLVFRNSRRKFGFHRERAPFVLIPQFTAVLGGTYGSGGVCC